MPLVIWTWSHPKSGSLSTLIRPHGEVVQIRHHPHDAEATVNTLGKIPPEKATALLKIAQKVLGQKSAEAAGMPPALPGAAMPERVEVTVYEAGASPPKSWGAPVSALDQHPELAALRRKIIQVRKRVDGGFFAWRSLAGRMAVLFGAVVVMMGYWLVRDSRSTDKLELTGQRLDAVVLERQGDSGYDKSKFIRVKLPATAAHPGVVKITEYLSAENWAAADPGTIVRVWHDTETGGAWLEKDIVRWQSDKKWVAILPLSIGAIGLLICLFARNYKVGAHGDGQEYLIRGDRVAGDDKDAVVSRTAVNTGKMLAMFARSK